MSASILLVCASKARDEQEARAMRFSRRGWRCLRSRGKCRAEGGGAAAGRVNFMVKLL